MARVVAETAERAAALELEEREGEKGGDLSATAAAAAPAAEEIAALEGGAERDDAVAGEGGGRCLDAAPVEAEALGAVAVAEGGREERNKRARAAEAVQRANTTLKEEEDDRAELSVSAVAFEALAEGAERVLQGKWNR